jgi:hypothetical protein
MTACSTVINPTASIPAAARLMSHGHFRHLPVSGDPDLSQRPTTGNARSV